MSDDVIRVEWFDGGYAEVSRIPYEWIIANVEQARTPMQRAVLYQIGARLGVVLGAVGDQTIETEQMRVARRNDASAAVVTAWDAFIRAISDHPTFRSEFAAAAQRRDIDEETATGYAGTLREVIDAYRQPERLPKDGRPPMLRNRFLVDATTQVMDALAVSESRAAQIVAAMTTMMGIEIDGECLRQTIRNDRVRK